MMDGQNSNTNRLPILDGTNYLYWETSRLRTHIKSIDVRSWKTILDGYQFPMLPPGADGDVVPKPESQWNGEEWTDSAYNEMALNAIFAYVDSHMFMLIQNCTTVKQAWEILETHCEGDQCVKESRVRLLLSQYEQLKMGEDDSITTYFEKLRTIPNEC